MASQSPEKGSQRREIMRKTAWILAAALLWTLPASADDDVVVRRFDKQLPLDGADRIVVDVPVGEVVIEGWDERQVHLEVTLECDEDEGSCADLAKRVKVTYSREGGDLTVRLKEWPKSRNRGLEAHVRVRVPRDLPLDAELGVGELRITSMASDIDADLGVGELNITMPAAAVASVSADTGVGEASLTAAGRHYESAGLVSREIRWSKGAGKARIEADLGVGEIDINLTK
jgi:hypothetical protein